MIYSRSHLRDVLCVDEATLTAVLAAAGESYAPFKKKTRRKDGTVKTRDLEPPMEGLLKKMQGNLNRFLQLDGSLSPNAFGGRKGHDSIKNSKYHQGSNCFFLTDLKNYFPLIPSQMVYQSFVRKNCSPSIARSLTRLVTFNGHVPQGAPTSTIVANIVLQMHAERKLLRLVEGRNIRFTLYVDDLTFSSQADFKELCPRILEVLEGAGFHISRDKTNYRSKAEITGNITSGSSIRPKPAIFEKADSSTSFGQKVGLQMHIKRVSKASKTPRKEVLGKSRIPR